MEYTLALPSLHMLTGAVHSTSSSLSINPMFLLRWRKPELDPPSLRGSQHSSPFAETTPPKPLLATIACPLIFVLEKPDDGKAGKSASVIAVFAPKILLTFMDDSIWASVVGGGDVGIDVDV